MPPTLLTRGVVIPHPDINPNQRGKDLASQIGRDYIVNYITHMDDQKHTAMGDKIYVIKSGTGSGKSSVLPPALLKNRGKRIAITQPTRLTAEQIPFDVIKHQKQLRMGDSIGYQTGLINKTPKKGLVYMTTGILLQQLLVMPPEQVIRKYSTIIIDEVHKHDLTTDFLLRTLKIFYRTNWNNPECPILIMMSATIEPDKYINYFDTKNYIDIKGEDSQPIEEKWPTTNCEDTDKYITGLITNIDTTTGDTLVFLPTIFAIKTLRELLEHEGIDNIVEVHSAVNDSSSYKELFHKPNNGGRIILATNAAETGVTFPFLQNIIDTGLAFQVIYNPQYAVTAMFIGPISQASARQRRGRVGRVTKGTYYPVFTKQTHEKLIVDPYPEMYSLDICSYLLNFIVKYMELEYDYDQRAVVKKGKLEFDPLSLELIHTPSSETMQLCFDKLYQLGLIDTDWNPTLSGFLVSRFRKISVEQAKMILSAYIYNADVMAVVVIAACLSVGTKKLGDLKSNIDDNAKYQISDEFIELVLVYEKIINEMQQNEDENPIKAIEQWFTGTGMDYQGWLDVIELVNEIQLQLIEIGLHVNMTRQTLLQQLKDGGSALEEVKKIKQCLLEAYRLNIATWNDIIGGYVSNYKNNKLKCNSQLIPTIGDNKPPKYILTDQIIYKANRSGQMNFHTGSCITVLDNFVEFDSHFLY